MKHIRKHIFSSGLDREQQVAYTKHPEELWGTPNLHPIAQKTAPKQSQLYITSDTE